MSESRERVHIEDSPKRVQTYFGGKLIADTKRLKLVWEGPYYPTYYFPREDVRMELLTANGHAQHQGKKKQTARETQVALCRTRCQGRAVCVHGSEAHGLDRTSGRESALLRQEGQEKTNVCL